MAAYNEPPDWITGKDGGRGAVFYQIFPDRFAMSGRVSKPNGLEHWDMPPTVHGYKGGDLLGIAERLDHLVELGITAIYLNPIFQSGSNHRYHTHDYFQVDPLLGGNDAFDEFLASCHDRGLRVVLDGVFNHASRGFFQFHDVLENGSGSPWIDWFHIYDWPLDPYGEEPANYGAWWGLKALPKFNTDNPQVREYLMQVGEFWARKGIDGWRLDVPEEIQTPGFWEEFRQRMRAIAPDLYIVGEIWSNASDYINDGTRFDATMNYPLTTAIIAYVAGGRVDPDTVLENAWYDITPAVDAAGYADRIDRLLASYPQHAHLANLNLLDSHDTARILSIAAGDVTSVELAMLLLMTFPGAPCVYYGTEIGLAGMRDPDCRRTMPWDESRWNTRLLDTTKKLIALRKAHPALRSPHYRRIWPAPADHGTMLTVFERRSDDGEEIIVAVNAGDADEALSLPLSDYPGDRLRPIWGDATIASGDHHARFQVRARSAVIWVLE
jgi:neopullulanase